MPNQGSSTPIPIRPTRDFQALRALGRPGGDKEGKAGSTDIQFFAEVATQAQWVGKCGLSAMTKPQMLAQTQRQYEEKYKRNRYFDEYKEAVGLALYQVLGIKTPEVALSLQFPAQVSPADEQLLGDMLEYHNPSLHLMTKFVHGFQVLGKSFIRDYQQKSDKSKPTVVTAADGAELALKGLGAALAMGCFLHDADCLGGSGANMGYVIVRDEKENQYATLIKIDAGTVFSFLEGNTGIYAHDPRKRDMFFGLQKEFILRYDQLNECDQAEFAATARRILQVPKADFQAVIDQGIAQEGFTPKQAQHILDELLSRKATFLNGFAPEVSAQLKAEVKAARQALLAELAGPQEEKEEFELNAALAAQEQRTIEQAALLEKERTQGAPEEKFETRVFQQPVVSQQFTGRVEVLEAITHALHAQQGSVITQVITGLGGVGKTQLAARYVQVAAEQSRYQNILWFNAQYSIDVQFIMLAQAWYKLSGLPTEKAIENVYQRLEQERTLIIFDNAIDQASIVPFLPPNLKKSSFHILITSRNQEWVEVPVLGLNGFSDQEGMAFIRKQLPEASEEDMQTLIDTVSHLPLALAHAVAYIAEGHCSLQDYSKQFALHQLSLISHSSTAQNGSEHTVLTTFLLTYVRLKQYHPIIAPILNACAYLAPEGIPSYWLEVGLAGPEDQKGAYVLGKYELSAVQEGLKALQRHGLLQSSKPKHMDMHRLIQQVIRHQLTPAEQQAKIRLVEQWVTKLNPQKGGKPAEESRWQAFLPHLEALMAQHEQVLGESAGLVVVLGQIAHIYSALGQPHKSRDLWTRALTIQEVCHGPNHHEVAMILNNLASAYGALGNMDKARDLSERSLTIKEEYYGPNHYEVALTLNNLANAYGALGNMAQKCNLLERALAILERHYDSNHYEVGIYGALGDMAKQQDLSKQNLAMTLMNLGTAHGALGDVGKQHKLLERSLTIKEEYYGPNHYEVAMTLTNLSNAYEALEDAGKQRKLLERSLKIFELHYGPNHPHVAISLTNLAVAYHKLNQPNAALQAAQCSYCILMNHPLYGAAHSMTEQCISYLQSNCGFTLEDLQSSAIIPKEKAAESPRSEARTMSSPAQLLSQHGLLSHSVLQIKKPDLVGSLKSQLLQGKLEALYAHFDAPKLEQDGQEQADAAALPQASGITNS